MDTAIKETKVSKYKNQILFFVALAVVFEVCNLITSGNFLNINNVMFFLAHSVFYIFVSWGMVFVFTTGIVDLSIGANVLVSGNVGALLAMELGWGYFGLIAGTVLSSALLELISVLMSVKLKIPSWISGLGMALVFEAILSIYGNFRAQEYGTNTLLLTSYRGFGTVPVMMVMLVVGFVVCYLIFNKSTIGINIAAIGDNKEVAQAMGINIAKTIIIGAMIGGAFIGLGALIQESYAGKMLPTSGLASLGSIFRSLAIILLAQSFSKLFTMPVAVLVCGITITALFNFLTLIGVPSGTGQDICLGALVIVCGVVSHWKFRGVVK